jgi:MFS family permease
MLTRTGAADEDEHRIRSRGVDTMEIQAVDTGMQPGPQPARRWHAGALSYSTAGLAALFVFLLLGDFAWALKERSVQEVFKVVLRQFSQNALLLNVLMGALPAVITMVVGPLVGGWSDRTRTRLGRRIPFLLATAPVIGASIVCLAYAEPMGDAIVALLGLPAQQRSVAVVGCMVVFWTMFEVATIIGNALFTALINDTVPHAVIGRFFGTFRMISLGVGAAFYYFLFDNNLLQAVRPIMIGIAVVYVAGFALLCWRVKEGAYPPPPPRVPSAGIDGLRDYLRGCTSVRFFVMVFIVVSIAIISFLPININSFNACEHFGVDRAGYANAIAVTFLISIALAFPIGWLTDRFHPLAIGFVMLSLYSANMLAGWFYVADARSFSLFLVVHGVLSGAFMTSTASLLPRVLPRHRFSELAAASAALTALLTVLFTPGMGLIIDMAGRDFRLIFLAAGLVSGIGALGWILVMREFARLGGSRRYVAPGAPVGVRQQAA